MRIRLLLTGFVAMAGTTILATSSVAQASTSQTSTSTRSSIKGGDIYQVRNITKGTDFKNTTSADKCDELQFRVRIHNTGTKNSLNNVKVRTAGSSSSANEHTSTVTIDATNAHAKSVSDTATIKLPDSSKITNIPGSTQLLNPSGKLIRNVNDMSRDTGVMIDSVGPVKDQRFVQFKVRVDCTSKPSRPSEPSRPSAPVTPSRPSEPSEEKKFACTALSSVEVDRTRHTVTATTNSTHATNKNLIFTVKNQEGSMVDTKTVIASEGKAEYQFDQSTPGVYTVSAVINTDASATESATCTKQITVHKEDRPEAPKVQGESSIPPSSSSPSVSESEPVGINAGAEETTPAAPSEPTPAPKETETLPATGAVGAAGIFVGVSTISSILYYIVSRRLSA